MANTASDLAFDIIRRGEEYVKPCQYTPTGRLAEGCASFLGRKLTHEIFITKGQRDLFVTLLEREGRSSITNGTGDGRFAAFVKEIYSNTKQKTFYLLCFGGVVPPVEQEQAEPKVSAPADASKAHRFAAVLILGAIDKGYDREDDHAAEGDESYRCAWLSKGQADALAKLMPSPASRRTGAS